MNRRARKILASNDGLGTANQRLVAARRRDNDRLCTLIRRTVVARRDGGHGPGGSLAVARPSAGRPYAVHVAPGSGLDSLVNAPATAALAGGQSLREYADAAGLSIHTVRSTLKQVFARTDTRSQAELVRLLLTARAAS